MAKVEAPNKEYNGAGPGGAKFKDGVAEVDSPAALNYYRNAGYKVGGKSPRTVTEPETPDPREVTEQSVGTRLRDAAVNPDQGDFLAPINAGEGNPHGPSVVSPEIHASGPAGIRPGEVFVEDVAKQDKRETGFAKAALIEQKPAGYLVAQEVPNQDERGDLGASDPGSAKQGKEAAVKATDDGPAPSKKPAAKKAASKKS